MKKKVQSQDKPKNKLPAAVHLGRLGGISTARKHPTLAKTRAKVANKKRIEIYGVPISVLSRLTRARIKYRGQSREWIGAQIAKLDADLEAWKR